ncbi:RNA polymerase sigma factor [Granulosicoccus sp.]|nr:RNA polymerase sigma factor [Granulosicoccus sp.]MDB4224413.1 RNA polymerase sigma factor [Granulosicoccus sp.]
MLPPFQLDQSINRLVREEWGRILASLVNTVGSLQLAEDALQDAVEIALLHWKENGIPKEPAAWLLTTAKRRAIDQLRRKARFDKLQPALSYSLDLEGSDNSAIDDEDDTVIPDKRLELIFTCCHPALDQKTRVALTLRALGGLTTDEIANAFLDKKSTMAQRLARAKHKIASTGIAYEVPPPEKLQERVNGVLSVVYFIFNEGYSASSGEQVIRTHLSDEAIRLGRVLQFLMPEHCEVAGLLSLMLLHESRRLSREDGNGDMVMLEHQNRMQWDSFKIEEGTALLKETLPRGQVGPYQLQAAISALHSESKHWEDTDWAQIAALYDLLYTMQPSPVVRVNQAVALSYARSPEAALELLDSLADQSIILEYQPYRIARAHILLRAGFKDEAAAQLRSAIEASDNAREKRFLEHRLVSDYKTTLH